MITPEDLARELEDRMQPLLQNRYGDEGDGKHMIALTKREAETIITALASLPSAEAGVEPVAWRDVNGFEDRYEISNRGDCRSKKSGRILTKNALAGSGYVKADLWKDGKRLQTYIHRLVAEAFVEGSGDEVNHKNGNKTDNRAENLEWCTRSENTNHAYYQLGHRIQPITAVNPDTGDVRHYRSVEECVRDGFSSAHVYRALNQPQRRVKGFHFTKAAPPTEAAPVSQTVQDAASSNAEIVVPYGSRNGATHLRTQGDNLTFCGRDSAAWSVVDGSVTEALESSFTCKLCLNAMSTTGDPSAEATPVVLRAKEIAASALQTACETDPADPEHPDTVMLTTGDFETIVRLAIENSCEGNPTEAAIRADEREKCLKIVQAHCCTGVDGDFYKGINSACHAIAKTIRSRGEG